MDGNSRMPAVRGGGGEGEESKVTTTITEGVVDLFFGPPSFTSSHTAGVYRLTCCLVAPAKHPLKKAKKGRGEWHQFGFSSRQKEFHTIFLQSCPFFVHCCSFFFVRNFLKYVF